MEAIILAGGLGTRLRSVVSDVPKPMADINGKPFLAILIEYWIKQGITRFILSVGYKHEIIQNYFGNEYNGAPIAYSVETEPLGTGGGLLLALDKLNSKNDCLILNGDTFFEINLQEFLAYHKNKKSDLTMALKKVENNLRYTGGLLDDDQRIISLSSKADGTECLINGGVYLAKPAIFYRFKSFFENKVSLENEIFPELLRQQTRFYGASFSGRFVDMGVPTGYELIRAESLNE